MNKTKAVKDLNRGECFTLSSSRGTVYRAIEVRTGDGVTRLTYSIPGAEHLGWNVYACPGLTTATLV